MTLISQLDICAGSVCFPIDLSPPLHHDHSQDHNVGKYVLKLSLLFNSNVSKKKNVLSDSSSFAFSRKDNLLPTKNNLEEIMVRIT